MCDGVYPVENQGFTLFCDACGDEVQSNEIHECEEAETPEVEMSYAASGKMSDKRKMTFIHYIKRRLVDVEIALKKDVGLMKNAAGMLPRKGKIKTGVAVRIMREIEKCDMQFLDEELGDIDEGWMEYFFS